MKRLSVRCIDTWGKEGKKVGEHTSIVADGGDSPGHTPFLRAPVIH